MNKSKANTHEDAVQKFVFVLLSLDVTRSIEYESVLAQAISARTLD